MRQITTHQASPLDNSLLLYADEPAGAGGASCDYFIAGIQEMLSPLGNQMPPPHPGYLIRIPFQRGPVPEVGITGVSIEALLAVVADRLEGFQSGPFACEENANALVNVKRAMEILQKRTQERLARNVEGTAQP